MASSSTDPLSDPNSKDPPPAESPGPPSGSTSKKRNAFDALMTAQSRAITSPKRLFLPSRDALGDYLDTPETLPPSVLVLSSPSFVTIRDKFPKSAVHLLLLPRDRNINLQHPLAVFSSPANAAFLDEVKVEAARIRNAVASELQRKYGGSKQWWGRKENILVGVHARPSMNHLHVHVMSADRVGTGMKSARHYLTFSTKFLVGLEEFPLEKHDERWKSGWTETVVKGDLVCWRCKRSWGRSWKKFRDHLEVEAEGWRKEGSKLVDEVPNAKEESGMRPPAKEYQAEDPGDDTADSETE